MDINGQKQGSVSPIIVDSKLKKAAEESRIPLSARLIYNLMVMCLLEMEELLDDFTVERLYPGILRTTALVQTESNARIAKRTIAQGTWLQKVFVAFELYGQEDIADGIVAQMLYKLAVTG